jgi:Flp pilus assembly protein TadG
MSERVRPWTRRWLARGDSGASAIEAAILAPAVLAVLGFSIAVMRIEVASQAVDSAAHDAARAASISRSADDAQTNGYATAVASLRRQDLACRTPQVTVDVREFGRPLGQEASVHVTVVCRVPLHDLGVPGLPGTKTLTARFSSPIDQYRGRS